MIRFLAFVYALTIPWLIQSQTSYLLEAEAFLDPGGWSVDPQFVQQMGSPYLMAHGMGRPVQDARTEFKVDQHGSYHVWVRTKDWAPGPWESPGRFIIYIDSIEHLVTPVPEWNWVYLDQYELAEGLVSISLRDVTGFNARCDAIYLSTDSVTPPIDYDALQVWRQAKHREPLAPEVEKTYDLVITGGGIAGCAAAIAAAEQGLEVALIHDRPVLGGNASSEIRVHTLGIYGKFERILRKIDTEHYPNGSAEAIRDQEKRDSNMHQYANLDIFLNWRAYDAVSKDSIIQYVDARHTSSGERIRFKSNLFLDSTGDGWIGYWAGAEYSYGRESVYKYGEKWPEWGELWSPEVGDNLVMGSSILWQTTLLDSATSFTEVPWAMDVARDHMATAGEWYWEFSRSDMHQIQDGEEIRDHLLRAIFGSFYNAKQDTSHSNYALEWVSYLLGKRESRRLMGDHIFTFNDVTELRKFKDSVVMEIREVDVHFQKQLDDEKQPDFLSTALFYKTSKYYIPYRSLYSRNIKNLFMAGRNFSCSHVGLGGPRVMRTTGQMGAAVGYAASLCKRFDVFPRAIYHSYLDQYMSLIEERQWLRP